MPTKLLYQYHAQRSFARGRAIKTLFRYCSWTEEELVT